MKIPRSSKDDFTAPPRIVAVDRLNSGIIIKFEDGQCGFYSEAYLFSKLTDCLTLSEDTTEW